MQRYTNWALLFFGAALTALWLVSPTWIPEVQPLLVSDTEADVFTCANYVNAAECDVLQQLFEANPEQALAQQAAMEPENDFVVNDDTPQQLAEALRAQLNISDTPVAIDISRGVFRPPQDAVHNASGQTRIFRISTIDGQTERVFLRLDAGLEGQFVVNNGPNLNLRIYLSRDANPEGGDTFEETALDVGALKGNIGQQNYPLADDLNVLQFRSAVIYNPDYDQIFGVAEFIPQQ